VFVTRVDEAGSRRSPDELIVEEPLEIRVDGHRVTTTMRTPGHDFELAAGFVWGEGLLGGFPVTGIRYCSGRGQERFTAGETGYNIVTVETGGMAPEPVARLAPATSACGMCGSDAIDVLCERLAPVPRAESMAADVLASVLTSVVAQQSLFALTGAVHGAAAFASTGELITVREDIGRHNAVDKVVGRLLLDDRLPATGLGLFVSGRASFEMVQKAWAAGFSTLVAVSAPSALAVDTARRAGITLIGFARPGRWNVYAPERP